MLTLFRRNDFVSLQSACLGEQLAVLLRTIEPWARGFLWFAAALVIALSGCSSAQQTKSADRDYELFVCAMSQISTAQNYVLVTIVDGRSGKDWQVALLSGTLRYAIQEEYHIPLGNGGEWKAVDTALKAVDRKFVFYRDSVIARVKPRYTPSLLSELRDRLAVMTNDEIADGFKANEQYPDSISMNKIFFSERYDDVYLAAFAHALLERDIPCGYGGTSGEFFIDRTPCPRKYR
jgi:hypothetical protein